MGAAFGKNVNASHTINKMVNEHLSEQECATRTDMTQRISMTNLDIDMGGGCDISIVNELDMRTDCRLDNFMQAFTEMKDKVETTQTAASGFGKNVNKPTRENYMRTMQQNIQRCKDEMNGQQTFDVKELAKIRCRHGPNSRLKLGNTASTVGVCIVDAAMELDASMDVTEKLTQKVEMMDPTSLLILVAGVIAVLYVLKSFSPLGMLMGRRRRDPYGMAGIAGKNGRRGGPQGAVVLNLGLKK